MKKRNPLAVFIFGFITGGIYSLYWNIDTKGEMNERGAQIPTAWLIIIPFVNIWWLWKYSEGVEKVTNQKMSGVLAFILELLLGPIGDAIIQDSFNTVSDTGVVSGSPVAPAPPVVAPNPAQAPIFPSSNPTPPTDSTPTPPTNPVG